jgi:UDP-N-acetylmuramate: L-alanyl-gamma-D-glutamyl-meso-diaminopimelate ligase
LCAYTVAKQLNISDKDIKSALKSFKGIKRRLEIIHKSNLVTLYDDFAHHPTSIKLTLEAVKNKNPKSFVVGLIDPRSNTMRHGDNKESLPRSLLSADLVLLYDHELLEWDAKSLLSGNKNIEFVNDVNGFIGRIEGVLSTNKDKKIEVVMMSNGSFDGLRERLVGVFGALDE